MSILIVTHHVLQQRLRLILETAGYSNLLATGSLQAACSMVEQTNNAGGLTQIDLVLLNVDMFDNADSASFHFLLNDAQQHQRPVLLLTDTLDNIQVQQALHAGATDVIVTPGHRVEVTARVQAALRLRTVLVERRAQAQKELQMSQQMESAIQRVQRLSTLDSLTGIANRRSFDQRLEREWWRAMRLGASLALIMIDIDDFKHYNDLYGHQQGDVCIQSVAQALAETITRPRDQLARYGGEEFVVVLPDTTLADAATIASALHNRVATLRLPHANSRVTNHVTLSLGIAALYPDRTLTPAALVKAADQALYAAKRAGRNRIHLADSFLIERAASAEKALM